MRLVFDTKLRSAAAFLARYPLIKYLAIESVMLIVLTALFVIEIVHLTNSRWYDVFLVDADSLTLPVIHKSIQLHEPAQWVFSSQLNMFPEGPIYLFSSLFGTSVKLAFFVNAFINFFLVYVLTRGLLYVIAGRGLRHRRIYSLFTMGLLTGFMLLEVPTEFGQAFYTYILFTTYYSGPLFVGLLNVLVLTYFVKQPVKFYRNKKSNVMLISLTLLNICLAVSNPLYVIQFTAPIVVTLTLFLYLRLIAPRPGFILIGLQLLAAIVGIAIQKLLFMSYVGESVSGHLNIVERLMHPLHTSLTLLTIIAPSEASPQTRLRLLLSIVLYFGFILFLLLRLNKQLKQPKKIKKIPVHALFLGVFLALQPIVLAAAIFVSSGGFARYYIAPLITGLFIIPFLAYFAGGFINKYMVRIVSIASAVVVVVGIIYLPKVNYYFTKSDGKIECLEKTFDYQQTNGLGNYAISRYFDVHNVSGMRVLQSNANAEVVPWLNNLGAYQNKNFTFYIVNNRGTTSFIQRLDDDKAPDGWSHTSECPNTTIYHYPVGTEGNRALNQKIQQSLHFMLDARQNGELYKVKKGDLIYGLPHEDDRN